MTRPAYARRRALYTIMARQRLTVAEAAIRLRVTPSAVRQAARRYGLTFRETQA